MSNTSVIIKRILFTGCQIGGPEVTETRPNLLLIGGASGASGDAENAAIK